MDRCYILHAKTVVSSAVQIVAAQKYGFKSAELHSDYGSHRVYIDKRMPGQKVGDWLVRMIGQTVPGDVIHLWDLTVLGSKEGIIAERLSEIAAQEASVRIMSTGALIKPTADTVALVTAMRGARQARGKKSVRLMLQAKRRTGLLGGAKPRFTKAHWDKAQAVWAVAKSQREFTLMIKEAGVPMHFSSAWRRSRGDAKAKPPRRPWPAMGSGKVSKPAPTKRKAKRRSKR